MAFGPKTKAVKNIVIDINFRASNILVKKMIDEKKEHPKLAKLVEVIKELKPGNGRFARAVSFTHFSWLRSAYQRKRHNRDRPLEQQGTTLIVPSTYRP